MPPSARSVEIVLATYNGERFLPEQLASLERQTFVAWRLIARDDGSTDGSRSCLAAFRARHPEKVQLIEDTDSRLGPTQNFGRVLARTSADFVLPCDQDDVWAPDKTAKLVELAVRRERPGVPLLVHSDLAVVDEALRPIAGSFWAYQFIRPERCRWPQLLVDNVVTGCASLINRPLCEAALPIPPEAILHDRWLALVAALTGEIHWLAEPTVQYRQHARNDTGANAWSVGQAAAHGGRLRKSGEYRRRIAAYRRQAAAAADLSATFRDPNARAVLREFATLGDRPYPGRVRFLLRHRIMKTGLLRNLGLLAWI
jgi:glycosyltransferase involved in cell wall biosynthesis